MVALGGCRDVTRGARTRWGEGDGRGVTGVRRGGRSCGRRRWRQRTAVVAAVAWLQVQAMDVAIMGGDGGARMLGGAACARRRGDGGGVDDVE